MAWDTAPRTFSRRFMTIRSSLDVAVYDSTFLICVQILFSLRIQHNSKESRKGQDSYLIVSLCSVSASTPDPFQHTPCFVPFAFITLPTTFQES
jgi:hypothetical protein